MWTPFIVLAASAAGDEKEAESLREICGAKH
jgi:hypothetical protein